MLEIKNVRKSFGDQEVLKGIDLHVRKGDVVAVIGPSGSGKTTLLRCLNFLEKADGGTMAFDGETFSLHDISKKDIARLRLKTGFVFQSYNLFLNKTALQNVTESLTVVRNMRKNDAADVAKAMLDKVDMADKYDSYPQQLSGGQQQRVAIARALAASPEIIYFDEPTSALDPELIGGVLEVMKKLAEDGMTMIVVTHEMNFARNVASKVVFMDKGAVLESGTAAEIFDNPRQPRLKEFLANMNTRQPA